MVCVTPRWSKPDSNRWSLSGIDAAAVQMTGDPCHAFRNGRVPAAGPQVRIRLAPAVSQAKLRPSRAENPGLSCRGTRSSSPSPSSSQSVSVVNPEAESEKPRTLAHSAAGLGREKGRAGFEPGLRRAFSLTGIDAVPPLEVRPSVHDGGTAARGAHLSGVAV